ncbi:DNA polymerase III subunit beta [Streptomyces sp. SM12]|uniref:DNA polymerase III subunit beta n=1 Tax=Streptomyces sp. SM12 TaxID=1071602 RepID=UPI000CD54CAE|nr:DNA polymerase III subunit beta [Streptomyces sp. SM12]
MLGVRSSHGQRRKPFRCQSDATRCARYPRRAGTVAEWKGVRVRFLVGQTELADAVSWAAHALPDRSPVPVHLGLMLTAEHGVLTVSGTGQDAWAAGTVTLPADAGGGRALVPGRALAELTRALPEAHEVRLAVADGELTLECGPVRFALPLIPPDSYPAAPRVPAAAGTVDAAQFARAVAQVAVSAGRDDTLPVLTGVWLETEGDRLRLVATDRYRLTVRDLPWHPARPEHEGNGDARGPDRGIRALVPAKSLLALARSAAGDGELSLAARTGADGTASTGAGVLALRSGSRSATTRLLSGTFLKYGALFPDTFPGSAVVERRPLLAAVRRVSLVAQGPAPLRLTLTGDAVVVELGDGGEARGRESVPALVDGPAVRLSADRGYVLDALSAITDPYTELSYLGPAQPAVFTGRSAPDAAHDPGHRCLVMLNKRS